MARIEEGRVLKKLHGLRGGGCKKDRPRIGGNPRGTSEDPLFMERTTPPSSPRSFLRGKKSLFLEEGGDLLPGLNLSRPEKEKKTRSILENLAGRGNILERLIVGNGQLLGGGSPSPDWEGTLLSRGLPFNKEECIKSSKNFEKKRLQA